MIENDSMTNGSGNLGDNSTRIFVRDTSRNIFRNIINLADEIDYTSVRSFSAAITPYYTLWRRQLQQIFDIIAVSGDKKFTSDAHQNDLYDCIEGLHDIDQNMFNYLSEPKLRYAGKEFALGQAEFMVQLESKLLSLLTQTINVQEISLLSLDTDMLRANSDSDSMAEDELDLLAAGIIKSCGPEDSAVHLSELLRAGPFSKVTSVKKRHELILSLRLANPKIGLLERAVGFEDKSPSASYILAYSDVLRKRLISALDLLETIRLKIETEGHQQEPEIKDSVEQEYSQDALDSAQQQEPIHKLSKHEKANKTLMVLDMLTMHNFRKLPSVAQLRTLEYEASLVMKDISDLKDVGDTTSKLDNMMEAFVRQCWRRRTNVSVLNANPVLLQLCIDSLLSKPTECKSDMGSEEKSMSGFSLTARQSVALGVMAVLFRYASNVEKIDTEKLKPILLLILSPATASKGLDLIRGFACCQGLVRMTDSSTPFSLKVLEFARSHISSNTITWGLATEICGYFATFCDNYSRVGISSLGIALFEDISSSVVRTLDQFGVPLNTKRISSIVLCEYCVRALETLSNLNPLLSRKLVSERTVQLLLRIMTRTETRPEVSAECGIFVWKLVLASHLAQCPIPSAAECVETLIDMIKRPQSDAAVRAATLRALTAFTFCKVEHCGQVCDRLLCIQNSYTVLL